MKLWFTFHNDKMFLNLRNFIRKMLGRKYVYLTRPKNDWLAMCWHDRSLGNPFESVNPLKEMVRKTGTTKEYLNSFTTNYIYN